MAWAHVQSLVDTTLTGSSVSKSFGSNTVVGNRVIVVAGYRASFVGDPGNGTVTDGVGNTYTRDATIQGFNDGTFYHYTSIFSAPITNQILSSTSITVTFNVSTDRVGLGLAEYSGLATSSAVDGSATGHSATTSITSGATSAAGASSELVFGAMVEPVSNSGTAWTSAPSGYTQRQASWGQFGPPVIWFGDKNSTASSTETISGTLPSNPDRDAEIAVVIYKLAGGAAPLTPGARIVWTPPWIR